MFAVHCVCTYEIARARIAARSANALPHRNLAEYERLRQIVEDFATPPEFTIDTGQTSPTLPPESPTRSSGFTQHTARSRSPERSPIYSSVPSDERVRKRGDELVGGCDKLPVHCREARLALLANGELEDLTDVWLAGDDVRRRGLS
ncbi:MAG: hypothetical protein ACR2H2_14770 [Solirubrobacteraceae bacterium]